jgi:hypothetical protein
MAGCKVVRHRAGGGAARERGARRGRDRGGQGRGRGQREGAREPRERWGMGAGRSGGWGARQMCGSLLLPGHALMPSNDGTRDSSGRTGRPAPTACARGRGASAARERPGVADVHGMALRLGACRIASPRSALAAQRCDAGGCHHALSAGAASAAGSTGRRAGRTRAAAA